MSAAFAAAVAAAAVDADSATTATSLRHGCGTLSCSNRSAALSAGALLRDGLTASLSGGILHRSAGHSAGALPRVGPSASNPGVCSRSTAERSGAPSQGFLPASFSGRAWACAPVRPLSPAARSLTGTSAAEFSTGASQQGLKSIPAQGSVPGAVSASAKSSCGFNGVAAQFRRAHVQPRHQAQGGSAQLNFRSCQRCACGTLKWAVLGLPLLTSISRSHQQPTRPEGSRFRPLSSLRHAVPLLVLLVL